MTPEAGRMMSVGRFSSSFAVVGTLAATVLALVCGAGSARAAPESPVLVESYVGERPKVAEYYLEILARSMAERPHRHGDALRKEAEAAVSKSAGPRKEVEGMRSLVEDGQRLFIEGKFDMAAAQLKRARELYLDRVGLVATDSTLRMGLRKALLYLAHCHLRSGNRKLANIRLAEVVRGFPDKDPKLTHFAPELVNAYNEVRQRLQKTANAGLFVETTPPGCLVYLNERYVGMSPVTVTDLIPGHYRVYVTKDRKPGRVHPVKLAAGETKLTVDYSLDRRFVSRPYVGLRFDDRAQAEAEELPMAAAVGRAFQAPSATVMSIRKRRGYTTLFATVIDTDTAKPRRSAMIHLEPAPPGLGKMAKLADFLLHGRRSKEFTVLFDGGANVPTTAPDETDEPSRLLMVSKWATLALAAGGVAGGVTLLVMDGNKTCDTPDGVRCPQNFATQTPGIALVAAGAALAAASAVLFYLDARQGGGDDEKPRATALAPWASPTAGGLSAAFAF